MNSKAFIVHSKRTIKQMQAAAANNDTRAHSTIQKDLTQLFRGLQNPSLMAAADLREAALEYGYDIDRRISESIAAFKFLDQKW